MKRPNPAWSRRVRRFLDHVWVRSVLSVSIVLSLVPVPWVSRLDPLFLVMFGAEFLLRLWLVLEGRTDFSNSSNTLAPSEDLTATPARKRASAWLLLGVDLIALASFLPLGDAVGSRWLRVFRLTRMLLLVGYWAPLVRDLWAILLRRERARQVMLMGVVVAGLSFAGAVLMHSLSVGGVDVDDDGQITSSDLSFLRLLWWAFRQLQDPGNMLAAPLGPAVMLISLVLTVFGLFLVSFLIGLGTDVVHELLELSRMRPSGLSGHTVIVNIAPSTRRLLHELLRYYQKLFPSEAPVLTTRWFGDLARRGLWGRRYLVVGQTPEPPEFLRLPGLSGIVYRQRAPEEEDLIVRADLLAAKRILLLADDTDSDPDAETIRTLVTLVERIRAQERKGELQGPPKRKRVIIAEILDESNVPAARAALLTGENSFRGFVVPTEKLLALFVASVVRRPGLERVLEELLTSAGHELYTCFFRTPGLGFSMNVAPALGRTSDGALDRLLGRGLAQANGRVIPVGLLVGTSEDSGVRDFEVWINPRGQALAPGESIRGFVALADNFGSVRRLAERLPTELPDSAHEGLTAGTSVLPVLARTHRRKMTRILVCGFRPGSIYMLEELLRSDPGGQVLVVVHSQDALDRALAAIDAHSQLVRRGLMHGRHGMFEPVTPTTFQFVVGSQRPEKGRTQLHVCIADWMASRHLVDLPAGFGHAADLDAVIFVVSDPATADKRTTTALLKLEQLFAGREGPCPRVVAEVIDGKLAHRLEQRYLELGVDGFRVFSIQELRAFFLFQAVVVPGFDTVYAELLGSWGQSFVHKRVVGAGPGRCTFVDLTLHLREQGEILVAVELGESERKTQLWIAPCATEAGAEFELETLRGVWVVAPDSGQVAVSAQVVGRTQDVADLL